ncbi:unknown protein [Parachlamydia acanthamoebae UV-7]|uniref:Uncharacterized protein n=2 Tax=Parachlamydia acanthamoebae TaxID=83552 RepID=F8L0G6_PARAV|nr:hypothetical protein DB43_GD00480 [Parachlamydia acanthamoebae]CCB86704.1 unknown protein [Parachlamydia acanthamoebae UV-7]
MVPENLEETIRRLDSAENQVLMSKPRTMVFINMKRKDVKSQKSILNSMKMNTTKVQMQIY